MGVFRNKYHYLCPLLKLSASTEPGAVRPGFAIFALGVGKYLRLIKVESFTPHFTPGLIVLRPSINHFYKHEAFAISFRPAP